MPHDSVVFAGATVHTPAPHVADLWVRGGLIERIEHSADPRTADALVIDVAGCAISTLVVDFGSTAGGRLEPGHPASFAVTSGIDAPPTIAATRFIRPAELRRLVVAGETVAIDGRPVVEPGAADYGIWLGDWSDPGRRLVQHLRVDGRYSETRSGRADAYTGQYWVRGAEIAYLDDTGFWAFGELVGEELRHADFVMHRT